MMIDHVLQSLFAIVILYAMGHDLLARTIPDTANLLLLALALAFRLHAGHVVASLEWAGAWTAFGLGIALIGAIGLGDVKMLPGIAMIMPPMVLDQMNFLVVTALAGGAVAFFYLGAGLIDRQRQRRRPRALNAPRPGDCLWQRWRRFESWRIRRMAGIPYGIAIGVGILVTMW